MRSLTYLILLSCAILACGLSPAGEERQPNHVVQDESIRLEGSGGNVDEIAFSADGRWLAAVSRQGQSLLLWSMHDLSAAPLTYFYPIEFEGIERVAFHPSSNYLVIRAGNQLLQLAILNGRLGEPIEIATLPFGAGPLHFSPDGQLLMAATQQGPSNPEATGLFIWQVDANGFITNENNYNLPHDRSINDILELPEQQLLLTAHHDYVNVWELEGIASSNPKAILPEQHFDTVTGLAYMTSSKQLISVARSIARLHLWEKTSAGNFEHVEAIETGGQFRAIALSPDEQWLAAAGCGQVRAGGGCFGGTLRLWNTSDFMQPAHTLTHTDIAAGSYSNDVAFTPDGNWLAVALDGGVVWLHPTTTFLPEQ